MSTGLLFVSSLLSLANADAELVIDGPFQPTKGSVVGYITIEEEMHIELDITVHTYPESNWESVFHCGTENAERLPGIWLHPKSVDQGFLTCWSHAEKSNDCKWDEPLTLNQTYHLEIDITSTLYTITRDGVQQYNGTKQDHTTYDSLACYASNPWASEGAADVTLSNIKIWSGAKPTDWDNTVDIAILQETVANLVTATATMANSIDKINDELVLLTEALDRISNAITTTTADPTTTTAVPATCDVTQCQATVYMDCPNSDHCGDGCEYLEDGMGDSGCAWNACSAVTGNGEWQNICGGIDAVDVEGGCSFQLAQGSDGANAYDTIYEAGFHGVWMTYSADGTHLGDNVGSIMMTCDAATTADPTTTTRDDTTANLLCDTDSYSTIKGQWSYDDSDCSLENTDSGAGNIVWFGSADGLTPDDSFDDDSFTMEALMEVHSGGDAGIMLRTGESSTRNNEGPTYYVGLYPSSDKVKFGTMDDGWSAKHTASVALEYDQIYTLSVEASGDLYSVYIDDVLVLADITRTEFGSGSIGLRTYGAPATYHSLSYSADE